jgi:class 3 adenylate cyclase
LRVEFGEDSRTEQVREVFITPLRDPQSGKFMGAMLFGLPLQVLAERVLYEQTKRSEFGEIMSGVWVEEALVSTTIPKNEREEVARHIAESIHRSGRAQREMSVPINGVRHQIFYRVLNPDSPFPLAAQVNLYPLDAMDRELAELRRDVGGLGLVALMIALLVVLYISRGLSGPISDIVSGTHQIEQGNFDVRVPVRRQDELGKLAASFNEMAAGLALQEKYRSVLNAVADRTVAAQLIEQSSGLGGEIRHVSMLFCDIRGFTAITENMEPAEVIELLNEHMTALTDVAYKHGGIVDKFVGDLIMVLFGAPISTGADALSAVQCALSMLQVRRTLNQTSKHSLEVGIGVATGSVVAGCMGSDQRLSYTVLGHRVNLASRLCSIAQAGEIVMDAETYAEAQELIRAEPMPPMQLKGISEPVHPWRVVAA